MSMSSTDKGLLTPENCAIILIDYQPQLFFGGTDRDWTKLLKNGLLLARAAKMFDVPMILTAIEGGQFDGKIAPQLLDLFPGQPAIQRSSINAWDDDGFVAAVRNTGRRNFVLAGLWSETSVVFPALQMLEEGYGIYAVKDASHGIDEAAQETALRRIEQAGGVSVTALQVLLEFQRDWANAEHCDEVTAIVKERCSGHTRSGETPAAMLQDVPGSRKAKARRQTPGQEELNRRARLLQKAEDKTIEHSNQSKL